MASVGTTMTSGDWVVSEGREDDFVAAWSELIRWSLEAIPGCRWATLIRQDDDPRHFISFGEWDGKEVVATWRQHPEFPEKLGAARSLCETFIGLDYTVAASAS